jgi:hypothetical protein
MAIKLLATTIPLQMLDDAFKIGGTLTVPGKYLFEFIPSLRFLQSGFLVQDSSAMPNTWAE